MRSVVTLFVLAAAIAAVLLLGGCAGLPIGRHTYLFAGIGVVRVQRDARSTAISSRSLGGLFGPEIVIVGAQQSFIARIPIDGDVAIIERDAGPDQHLDVTPLHMEKTK